jgi:hypothetical protein
MADTVIVNLDDVPVIIEKRGHGRPRGSKNKSKTVVAASTSTTPVKRRRGRPLESKNKKLSVVIVGASTAPNVSLAQPILPPASADNVFCFFVFAGAQCREGQRLPLKSVEFMDGHELHEAIL